MCQSNFGMCLRETDKPINLRLFPCMALLWFFYLLTPSKWQIYVHKYAILDAVKWEYASLALSKSDNIYSAVLAYIYWLSTKDVMLCAALFHGWEQSPGNQWNLLLPGGFLEFCKNETKVVHELESDLVTFGQIKASRFVSLC